ncbi:hypothetical protein [Pseudoalteromonas atlantica]|uniref:hypothetical protein n=1 Tax=Pseudoalteromonas atlantica TaxID=288 RepID=UPI0012FE5F5F|nr:hypothetical protein [Pseudoalteromonas atlantica]
MNIKIFGDSHSKYFQKTLNTEHLRTFLLGMEKTVYRFDGSSVKGIGKRASTLNIQSEILANVDSHDVVVLAFGQVDVELGYYYKKFIKQSRQSFESFTEECISAYIILITELLHITKKVIIKGLNHPVLVGNEITCRYVSRIITENITSEIDSKHIFRELLNNMPSFQSRLNQTMYFNFQLEAMATKLGVGFFSINSCICTPSGQVEMKYRPATFDHHLVDSIEVREIHHMCLGRALTNLLVKKGGSDD